MPATYTAKGRGKQIAANFARDMSKFKQKTFQQIENAIKDAVGRLYDDIIQNSVVDTGLYKANHQLELNSGNDDFVYRERPEKGATYPAGPTISLAKANLSGYKLGDKIFIFNNLIYAIPLEYGWSKKQGVGLYRLSAMNFKYYLLEAAGRY